MKRYEIRNGALAPIAAAAGASVPARWQDSARRRPDTPQETQRRPPAAPLKMEISGREEALRNGKYLLERIRETARALLIGPLDDRKRVLELARLVAHVRSLTISVPEVIEYLGRLLTGGYTQALNAVLGGVRRGRPTKRFDYLVALIDLIKQQETVRSDAAACELLRSLPGSPFDDIAAGRMKVIYSEHREMIHASRSYFVDEKELAKAPRDLLADFRGAIAR